MYVIEGGSYSIDGKDMTGKKIIELDASKVTNLGSKEAPGKLPEEMSVKELKAGIAKAGLGEQAAGLSEKQELVDLLNGASGGGGPNVEFLLLQGVPIGEPVAKVRVLSWERGPGAASRSGGRRRERKNAFAKKHTVFV